MIGWASRLGKEDMKAIEAYDSAYPGSMSQREDGSFIRREDADSLAGALLALVKSGDRAAEDLQDALTEANKDAARYRWLRENRDVLLLTGFFGNGCINRTISERICKWI